MRNNILMFRDCGKMNGPRISLSPLLGEHHPYIDLRLSMTNMSLFSAGVSPVGIGIFEAPISDP
jgi:hypothetical protein